MIEGFGGPFREERDTTLLGLVRVIFGCLLLWNGINLVTDLRENGYFGDRFSMPLIKDAWVPSRNVFVLLLVLKLTASVCAIVGIVPRIGLLASAAIGLYVFACDRLQYHNNRYATNLLGFLLAFTPCDRSYRLLYPRRTGAGASGRGPWWAVRLLGVQLSLIYLASGLGKLVDPDWRGGAVMLGRFADGIAKVRASGHELPGAATDLLTSPVFAGLASKAAISTELFLAIGLWLARTRPLALWLGLVFHLGIEMTAKVDLFSWLMLGAYLLFVKPELGERRLLCDTARRAGRLVSLGVQSLDWLKRFRVTAGKPAGGVFEITDRDGRVHRGFAAVVALSRGIPLLFLLWLPLAALSWVTSRKSG